MTDQPEVEPRCRSRRTSEIARPLFSSAPSQDTIPPEINSNDFGVFWN